MDFSQSFAISALGMNIERARVDVAALNLANAGTVQTVGGGGYRPLRVLAEAGDFGALVSSMRIVPTDAAPRRVYEPGHPMADERGFVSYAGVDTATEMVSLMSATRAYEANVAAMNTTRTLAMRALDIGGGNG